MLDIESLCINCNTLKNFSKYNKDEYPEPFPVQIRTTFTIDDILNIDEDLQVIHVLLTLNAEWSDGRILLQIPEQNKPK